MDYVTLANGEKVEWDEFSKWSSLKQRFNVDPPNKGKIFKESIRKKMSESMCNAKRSGDVKILTGGEHPGSRKVLTPEGEFCSIKEAANHYNTTGKTIRAWIDSGKAGFKYLSPKPIKKSPNLANGNQFKSKAVLTPEGRFKSMKECSDALGISLHTLRVRIANPIYDEYRFEL